MDNHSYNFITQAHGKWILTGEHAVLRGCPALLFPVSSRYLTLAYQTTQVEPRIKLFGEHDGALNVVFTNALQRSMQLIDQDAKLLQGNFYLQSSIPIGSGMGASAALCVAIGRWLVWQGWLAEAELFEFGRNLENLFHQESSGADIAACLANTGTYFVRQGERKLLTLNWQPTWYLSHTGQNSSTASCIDKVKMLLQKHPSLGQHIDVDMHKSVRLAEQALALSQAEGMPLLKQAIDLGCSCFERWGLINDKVGEHIQQLRQAGAVAVKPTGSGNGGFVLSLWSKPPQVSSFELIAL